MNIEFFVPGLPVPKGSKDLVGGRRGGLPHMIDSNRAALIKWQTCIAIMARMHRVTFRPAGTPCLVSLRFMMPRAKSNKARYHTKKPDVDKLPRAVMDALTGIAWHDDSQVVSLVSSKEYSLTPEDVGVFITLSVPECWSDE